MTVGIAINNKREGVAVIDTQVTYGGARTSNSINKVGTFTIKEGIHGAIFGSGMSFRVTNILDLLDDNEITGKSLEGIATSIQDNDQANVRKYISDYARRAKEEAKAMDKVLDSDEKKAKFIEEVEKETIQKMQAVLKDTQTSFVAMGYNKRTDRIEMYMIDGKAKILAKTDKVEIGSGQDLANAYSIINFPGLDTTKLTIPELVLHGLNAYSWAYSNPGVGGIPTIVTIGKKDAKRHDTGVGIVLGNYSGAYLSGLDPKNLSYDNVVGVIGEALETGKVDTSYLKKATGFNEKSLTNMYMPANHFMEMVNLSRNGISSQ